MIIIIIIIIITIIPLFTLSSIYSTNTSGAEQMPETIIQIKHNRVKNPNQLKANQLAIYKHGRGSELGTTVKQIQLAVRAGPELGASGLQVQRSNHSATLSPINITPGLEYKLNWNESDAMKTLQHGIYYIPENHEVSVQIKLCGIEKQKLTVKNYQIQICHMLSMYIIKQDQK